ncbi:hypothetical protein C8J56DRAFT_795864, partial [Mycena floridula]
IYRNRCHSSGHLLHYKVVPNARCALTIGHVYLDMVEKYNCEIPVQMTVDGGSGTGKMYAMQVALREKYLAEYSVKEVLAFTTLKSTNNIPIESSWSYMGKQIGYDIKNIFLLEKINGYFNGAIELHVALFRWLWPQLVQKALEDFVQN